MRVMIMLSNIPMGGGERNVVSMMPYMKQQGIEVVLGTLSTRFDSPLALEFANSGLERINLGARRMIDTRAFRRFRNLLRERKFDIVHSEDQDVIMYGAMAHRFFGQATVMSRHVLVEPSDTWKESVRARMVLTAARVGFNRVVAVSEATRHQFSTLSGLSLNKIETIYNGIALEKFDTRAQREATRAQLGWLPDQKIVVMVAVLRRGKGHEVLFEAIPHLQAAIPNVKIKLIGEGELHDTLHKQATQFGDAIEFMGQRMDIPALLGGADVLVLPSWSEALPTVLIEAGAAALPVVATNVGGTSEIVVEGETGWIVAAGDAAALADRLAHVLNHPSDALKMGQAAQVRVRKLFTFEQQAAKTIQLYQSILKERKHR